MSDFTSSSLNGECYYISKTAAFPVETGNMYGTYYKAEQVCQDLGADLVSIGSEAENQVLVDMAGTYVNFN